MLPILFLMMCFFIGPQYPVGNAIPFSWSMKIFCSSLVSTYGAGGFKKCPPSSGPRRSHKCSRIPSSSMSRRDTTVFLAPKINFNKLSQMLRSMCMTSSSWRIGSFCCHESGAKSHMVQHQRMFAKRMSNTKQIFTACSFGHLRECQIRNKCSQHVLTSMGEV